MVSESKTVLVLGGGIGGVATARALRRQLPRQHRIVLVDRERNQLFAPSLLWLMVGQREAASIQRPLERLGQLLHASRCGGVLVDPAQLSCRPTSSS